MVFKKMKSARIAPAILKQKLIAHTEPQSKISEQYRTIRTNTFFSSVSQSIQSLVVTSTNPEEGKSTTVANLAIVFANQGKKVLLVDADMRKPTLHFMFNVQNAVGLSNVLMNEIDFEEAYTKTDIDHLFALSSGPVPPNPAELLGSLAMQTFIEKAKKSFDYILFDTPPILAVTDPHVLANQCDGAILVVNSGKTDVKNCRKSKEILSTSNACLLGVVLNNYNSKEKHYNYS